MTTTTALALTVAAIVAGIIGVLWLVLSADRIDELIYLDAIDHEDWTAVDRQMGVDDDE